jgi:ABC-type transport system involved in multi-copper enzyme maturation permease subunit
MIGDAGEHVGQSNTAPSDGSKTLTTPRKVSLSSSLVLFLLLLHSYLLSNEKFSLVSFLCYMETCLTGIQIPLFLLLASQNQRQTKSVIPLFLYIAHNKMSSLEEDTASFKQSMIGSGKLEDNQEEDNNDNVNSPATDDNSKDLTAIITPLNSQATSLLIITPYGKFCYQHLPMGICNALILFKLTVAQEIMDEQRN